MLLSKNVIACSLRPPADSPTHKPPYIPTPHDVSVRIIYNNNPMRSAVVVKNGDIIRVHRMTMCIQSD